MSVSWCIYGGCQFHCIGLKKLEDHWIEQHGATRTKRKKTKVELTDLFDWGPFVRS